MAEVTKEYVAMSRKILRDDSPLFTQEIENERP